MAECKFIELSNEIKAVVASELEKELKSEHKEKRVEVLGMFVSNVNAFAPMSELNRAWQYIMEAKESRFGDDTWPYPQPLRMWDDFPGTVNTEREAFRNPLLTQRFDVIIAKFH